MATVYPFLDVSTGDTWVYQTTVSKSIVETEQILVSVASGGTVTFNNVADDSFYSVMLV